MSWVWDEINFSETPLAGNPTNYTYCKDYEILTLCKDASHIKIQSQGQLCPVFVYLICFLIGSSTSACAVYQVFVGMIRHDVYVQVWIDKHCLY